MPWKQMSYQLHMPWSTASHTMRAANQHHSLLPHTSATLAGFQTFEVAYIAGSLQCEKTGHSVRLN